jgi:hypothetical protein
MFLKALLAIFAKSSMDLSPVNKTSRLTPLKSICSIMTT